MDKIKANFKTQFDEKRNGGSIESHHHHEAEADVEESCMGKGPCAGLGKVFKSFLL